MAAAIFDVLWSVASYERLVVDWQLDHDLAVRALTWVIGLVAREVLQDASVGPAAEEEPLPQGGR